MAPFGSSTLWRLVAVLLLCPAFASSSVATGAAGASPRGGGRADAERAVRALGASSSLGAGVSRIRYLGEERWSSERVVEWLRNETNTEVRRNLADALAQLSVKATEPTLVALTTDADRQCG